MYLGQTRGPHKRHGAPQDYEIHDALVPSNFAWNMSQAQRKKAAAKAEKAQAQAAAQAKTAVENGWEQVPSVCRVHGPAPSEVGAPPPPPPTK